MDPVARAVEDCRTLTARMLEAAEGGDWPTVASLDDERRGCFTQVDLTALPPDAAQAVLDAFHEMITLDERLRSRAAEARTAALNALRRTRERQQGGASYREQAAQG